MEIGEQSLKQHALWKGKLEVRARVPAKSREDLSLCYTPGVAAPCLAIRDNKDLSYSLTRKWNTVAVVTDGSAVLGLGDIGPSAAMPVMEGKCVLFKAFADIDAIPLCIRSNDIDEIVRTVFLLSDSFGGINLEDIAAPRCFEIERRLKELCDVPVFHDDQHGTAIVVAAALINALKVTNKSRDAVRIVISGAGSAGIAITKHLLHMGFSHLTLVDRSGILSKGCTDLNPEQQALLLKTNLEHQTGSLADALRGADVFIGVSAPGIVTKEMISSMAQDPIVFAMANPTPEIMPDLALSAGAAVVGTGRSDFPNQINNVLAFPGVFRGALDARVSEITQEMKTAASLALAGLVCQKDLRPDYILPDAFDPRIAKTVAKACESAAHSTIS